MELHYRRPRWQLLDAEAISGQHIETLHNIDCVAIHIRFNVIFPNNRLFFIPSNYYIHYSIKN